MIKIINFSHNAFLTDYFTVKIFDYTTGEISKYNVNILKEDVMKFGNIIISVSNKEIKIINIIDNNLDISKLEFNKDTQLYIDYEKHKLYIYEVNGKLKLLKELNFGGIE